MEVITYSLNGKHDGEFYEQLSVFSTKIISEAKYYFSADVSAFKAYLKKAEKAKIKSEEEYLIEFITSGIYMEKYASYAASSDNISIFLLHNLYLLRKKYSFTKPVVDFLRGHLSGWLLYSLKLKTYDYSSEVFSGLLKWLKATGEFNEETKRLELWNRYYKSLPSKEAVNIITRSVAFAKYFKEQGKLHLGVFTHNVNNFLENDLRKYKNREDCLFCGKSESEYHLNMFGAEILNRKLRKSFMDTTEKTVLLPSCMCNPNDGKCKAIKNGMHKKCISCSNNCDVNKIQKTLRAKGTETYLITHSSNFSESLKLWQNQDHTGLVGVACVLNLITGGYEMQGLNIPSQCVFLDYCGCKKHWHSKGIPTGINRKQLDKILDKAETKSFVQAENKKLVEAESAV
jgi:uncharacterized protein